MACFLVWGCVSHSTCIPLASQTDPHDSYLPRWQWSQWGWDDDTGEHAFMDVTKHLPGWINGNVNGFDSNTNTRTHGNIHGFQQHTPSRSVSREQTEALQPATSARNPACWSFHSQGSTLSLQQQPKQIWPLRCACKQTTLSEAQEQIPSVRIKENACCDQAIAMTWRSGHTWDFHDNTQEQRLHHQCWFRLYQPTPLG